MELLINSLQDNQIINSYNFARHANHVYSEIISRENYKKLDTKNHVIIFENQDYIFYKASYLNIKDGDTIFSNTDLVEPLFEKIKKTELKNLKLITTQTDRKINKNLYLKKPNNFARWFSINVDTLQDDLIPIPYGLANSYSAKNLSKIHYANLKNGIKINKIYANFEINTNYFHRIFLKKNILNNNIFLFENNKLGLNEYVENLNMFQFILCPWGNGYDTHRLWETLYAGSIAIVPQHKTYSSLDGLPIIQFKNAKDFNIEKLLLLQDNLSYEYKKLNIEYWLNKIIDQKSLIKNSNNVYVKFDNSYDINLYFKLIENQKKLKTFKTKLRKLHSRIIN